MSPAVFAHPSPQPIPASLLVLFAAGAGLAVACLYYNQPMLAVIGIDLKVAPHALGMIPTLTQLGYALGILFLAPLGDRHDRRSAILIKGLLLVGALLMSATATSLFVLEAASLAVGIFATLAQDIVPAAAHLSSDAARGRVVGKVMMGLLLGILLSRVIGGVVAEQFGWREMFFAAAASIALLCIVAWFRLPNIAPTTQVSYRALLKSLWHLWYEHPTLRQAAIAQGLLMLAFGAFWSTLAVMLYAPPFHLGSAAAGAYGLAGAAGVFAAPLAGHFADHRGPEVVTRLGTFLVAVAFAAMFLFPWLSVAASLWLLALSSIVFDLGIQSTLIAHQTIIYSLDPAARSRLNALLFIGMFSGMAAGSALGSLLLVKTGWMGVVTLATVAGAAAMALRFMPERERP